MKQGFAKVFNLDQAMFASKLGAFAVMLGSMSVATSAMKEEKRHTSFAKDRLFSLHGPLTTE